MLMILISFERLPFVNNITGKNYKPFDYYGDYSIEVIGNIYKNPELLERS